MTHDRFVPPEIIRRKISLEEVCTDWSEYRHQTDSGLADEICQRHLGRAPEPEELAQLQQQFLQGLEGATRAGQRIGEVRGASAFLRSDLLRGEWKIAIATGGWSASAVLKLRSAGFVSNDLPMATADDAVDRIEILRAAIRRAEQVYGAPFHRIVYVGDNLWDLRAARKLGLGFVGIACGETARCLQRELNACRCSSE